MGIVPLTLGQPNPTIVTSNEDFDRDSRAVLILGMDETQLVDGASECNVAYDLRVGDHYRDHRDTGSRSLEEGGRLSLMPGMAVIIKTEELIHMPKSFFGQIAPKVSLLQEGLSNTPTKIDPGYDGHLLITVFNHGQIPVHLDRCQQFCSLYISTVEAGIKPYDKVGKELPGGMGGNRLRILRDWLQRNAGLIGAVSALVSLLAGSLALVAFFG